MSCTHPRAWVSWGTHLAENITPDISLEARSPEARPWSAASPARRKDGSCQQLAGRGRAVMEGSKMAQQLLPGELRQGLHKVGRQMP